MEVRGRSDLAELCVIITDQDYNESPNREDDEKGS